MACYFATIAGAVCGAEGAPAAGGWVIRSWATGDGLPQNTINAMVQTRDGYLWLGTRDGLARFDGVRFTVLGLAEGLQSVDILALHEDRHGTLWIGTSGGGLSRLRNGRVESVTNLQQRAGSEIVTALVEDAQGRLWAGTRGGLRRLKDDVLVEEPASGELCNAPTRALLVDRQGSVWASAFGLGLFEFRGDTLTPRPGPAANPTVYAYSLCEDRRGRLWASVGNGMVLCRQEGEWRVFDETNGVPFAFVTSLIEDDQGVIWAGSLDAGLYYFDGTRFHVIRQQDGLSADDIRSLLQDREGNLWVGTRTGGLNRMSRRRLLHVGAAQGLTNDFTRAVTQSADGRLWVATTGGGLWQGEWPDLSLQESSISPLTSSVPVFQMKGLPSFKPFRPSPLASFYAHMETVIATKDGSIWWGGANALLRWQEGRGMEAYTNLAWLRPGTVSALAEGARGELYIGTIEGRLLRHEAGGELAEHSGAIARGAISALAVQPDGAVWVGSVAGGLKRITRDGAVLGVTHGLLSDSIRTLRLDAKGVLWIGTTGGGLSCRVGERVTSFTSEQGLGVRTVSQIVEDDLGHLWLGTSRGILKVSRQDLVDYAAGRLEYVHARSLGVNDGMPAEECAGGFSPAGLRTRDGLICFSTVKGLVFVDPREQPGEVAPPVALLEEVRVGGRIQRLEVAGSEDLADGKSDKSTALNGAVAAANQVNGPTAAARSARRIVVPPGNRELELHYTGIQFSSPEELEFRYQLQGVDEDWVNAGIRRTAYYPYLRPGDYKFRVKACSAEGTWGEPTNVLSVVVLPFLWETAWFRSGTGALIAGGLAGALWWGLRRRYQRRLERLQLQHAVERERLRISQDMHDHVGAMLTQVSQLSDMGLGEAGERSPIRGRFERIGTQARNAVQALDEIVWATNPKNDNLASFADYVSRFAEDFFEPGGVRCWQEFPVQLPHLPLQANVRHNLFLALKEACHNVLKHSHATEVRLRMATPPGELVVEVEDNGCGFATDAANAKSGNGLTNMRARLEEDGGKTTIISTPGKGTLVRLRLPVGQIPGLRAPPANAAADAGEQAHQ